MKPERKFAYEFLDWAENCAHMFVWVKSELVPLSDDDGWLGLIEMAKAEVDEDVIDVFTEAAQAVDRVVYRGHSEDEL